MIFEDFAKNVNVGFMHKIVDGVEYLTIPSFDDKIIHGFTTRHTGVSKDGFSSLNFSFGREKNEDNIRENFFIISKALGFDENDIVLDNYGHTSNVILAGEAERGKGVYNNADLPVCDGLVTKTKRLPLCTMHADCAPIFFYDNINMVVCVCHAGWRGVVSGIVKNALDVMTNEAGCEKQNIQIGVGPCIRSCCFEIKEDLESVFLKEFGTFSVHYRQGKMYGDLEKGILYSIFKQGIEPEKVTVAQECTCCNDDKYYSYRRQGQDGGAMASFIYIK